MTAPAGDSEDFFFVNQLQTMNVNGGHTLTLDGQDGTDTYVVNTTGSQPCLGADQITGATCHNYVINVLDTGAPNRGSDVLIVNGIDAACSGYCERDDAVPDRRHLPAAPLELHRLVPGRRAEPGQRDRRRAGLRGAAPRQLRHGHAGRRHDQHRPEALLRHDAGSCTLGQTLIANAPVFTAANGFFVGRRIHLGNANVTGNAGVFAGDYTIQSIDSATQITLSEKLPTGVSLTTEQVPTSDVVFHNVSIGILYGDVTTPDPSGDSNLRNQSYERINYDTAINGRLIVNGLGATTTSRPTTTARSRRSTAVPATTRSRSARSSASRATRSAAGGDGSPADGTTARRASSRTTSRR